MPLFDIEDEKGRKLTIKGDVAPDADEIDEIFSSHFGVEPSRSFRSPEQKATDAKRISAEIESKSDSSPRWLGATLGAVGAVGPYIEGLKDPYNIPNRAINAVAGREVVAPLRPIDTTGLTESLLKPVEVAIQHGNPGFTLSQ